MKKLKTREDRDKAANKLHHLSMRYVGACKELATGEKAGLIPNTHPGVKEFRDFVDLILLTRAEINGLTKLLLKAGLLTAEDIIDTFAEEYEWLAQEKAKQFGVQVTDLGLVFNKDSK